MNKKLMNNKEVTQMPTGEQINKALFWVDDLLDRCQIPYVIVGDIAKQLYKNNDASKQLNAHKIEILVKNGNINPMTKGLLKTFVPWIEFGKKILLEFEGVSIEIKVLKRKYQFIEYPDLRFYMSDEYKIPNQFDRYWKARFIL